MPQLGLLGLLVLTLVFLSNPNNAVKEESKQPVEELKITFDAQDKYTEQHVDTNVRVYKTNNKIVNLGKLTTTGSSLITNPGFKYRYYFFMGDEPSTKYYVDIQDSNDVITSYVGKGCQIASSLTTSILYNNRPVSDADPLLLDAEQEKSVQVKISVPTGQCYGMPGIDKQNSICLIHTEYVSVDVNSENSFIPNDIYRANRINHIDCYYMPKIENGETITIPVKIKSGLTNPTKVDNIYIYTDDVAFDIKNTRYKEIFDFNDEYGNNLGAPMMELGAIYIG